MRRKIGKLVFQALGSLLIFPRKKSKVKLVITILYIIIVFLCRKILINFLTRRKGERVLYVGSCQSGGEKVGFQLVPCTSALDLILTPIRFNYYSYDLKRPTYQL